MKDEKKPDEKKLNERIRKFTAIGVEAFKPKGKRFEVSDGTSLRLFVFPSGAKSWGMRYRPPGSRKAAKLVFGKWPAVTLAQARVAVADAKLVLSRGIDPAGARREAKVAAEIAAVELAAIRDRAVSAIRRTQA